MFDKFSERHIGVSNEKDLKAMLDVIGVKSVDELISQVIPQSIRLRKPLALPAEGMSEYEFAAFRRVSNSNPPLNPLLGGGLSQRDRDFSRDLTGLQVIFNS